MAWKILLPQEIMSEGRKLLEDAGHTIIDGRGFEPEDVLADFKEYQPDAMIVRITPISREIIESNPNLKVIVRHGAGFDALDVKVIAYDAHQSPQGAELAEYVDLDTLWARSDVIFLHCPLFPETQGIINRDTIEKMKDGVILINNSRGQLVVERDLADALNSGKVYAAGLDVVSTEPIRGDNPLLRARNCIITPHISWAARESRERILDATVENIRAFLDGSPVHVVN